MIALALISSIAFVAGLSLGFYRGENHGAKVVAVAVGKWYCGERPGTLYEILKKFPTAR